jgi:DNA-binding transcriptional LysR family regulator
MELRHLRYFVAVVEAGSLTTAAELRLHTSQPSLSRQIRDLEYQVGAELLSRSVHGVELTAAGKAFLDHARLALAQVDAAVEAARRAAQPARKTFAIGFQTGEEMQWLSRAMQVLRDELKNIQVTVSSDYSPDLAEALIRGRLDVAFLRVEPALSLVASTRGLALMPAYAKNLLPWSVVSRPLEGEAPTIDLAVGYSKANTSPILKLFLARLGELRAPTAAGDPARPRG